MLAATIVSTAQDAPIQRLFDAVAQDARAAWQRSALLRGAEVTLLERRRARAAPDAVADGAPRGGGCAVPDLSRRPRRSGRGSRRFRATSGAADPSLAGRGRAGARRPRAGRGGRGRGAARPALKLTREPAIAALAAANGRRPVVARDRGARATGVARQARDGRRGDAARRRRSRRASRPAAPSTRTCARPATSRTAAAWRSWRRR